MLAVVQKFVGFVVGVAIGNGFLLWLSDKRIYPARWVRDMLSWTDGLVDDDVAYWILLALFGLAATALWTAIEARFKRKKAGGGDGPIPDERASGGSEAEQQPLIYIEKFVYHERERVVPQDQEATRSREMTNDKKSGDTYNVNTTNQSGGLTAGRIDQVNIAPGQRTIGDDLKAQLLGLPRDKPIDIVAVMGDSEALCLAIEVNAFLRANGFETPHPTNVSQAVFTDVPGPLTFHPEARKLIVGSNR